MSNTTSLMEFPCNFSVKIIGNNSPSFTREVQKITFIHFSNFKEQDLVYKPSEKNNYIAITATVYATNQAMLDAYYEELTKIPEIKMVL